MQFPVYKIGSYTKPTKENGYDYWTLDIDFETDDSGRPDHGGIIQIHGETLSQCMLKAKFMCLVLNSGGMTMAEALVKLLDVSRITFEK